MSGRVASRCVAVFVVACALFFGGAATALAQYQLGLPAAAMPAQMAGTAEPFGLAVTPVTEGEVLNKWNGVIAEISAESGILTRCGDAVVPCQPAAQKFLAVIAEGRSHDGRARFGIVNRDVNLAIIPTSDFTQWGETDHWSAPLVTFESGRGDCEDYAIAKYVALEQAGVSASDLRLVILRDLATGEDHAVVTARFDEKWFVLDNRRLVMLEDIEMQHVLPLFVLDREGVRQFTAPAMALLRSSTTTAPASLAN